MRILIILLLVTSCGCICKEEDLVYKTVKSIGGCDKSGYCGVMFEDGTSGRKSYPIVGMKVRTGCKK
jgi:hypothetical protein